METLIGPPTGPLVPIVQNAITQIEREGFIDAVCDTTIAAIETKTGFFRDFHSLQLDP